MEKIHGVESKAEGSGGEIVSGTVAFDSLPEGCISNIISFTSPRDACVLASVSKTFDSAAKSDIVWKKFLPSDNSYMVPRSGDFSSKKEIYFDLCHNPVLIKNNKMSLWLDKASGKNCIMLSAKNITIKWGDDRHYWQWIKTPKSRFKEVAELLKVPSFEIRGRMKTSFLSPRTRYSAYIVFKKTSGSKGFTDEAIEAEVGVVGHKASRRLVCFGASKGMRDEMSATAKNLVKPEGREDGWMEIELGDFFNEGEFDEIELSALEIGGFNSKSGLIIQGIEFRPTKTG